MYLCDISVFVLLSFCLMHTHKLFLWFQITQGLDLLDEMQARGLEVTCYSYNPFIREFSRWTMIDEVGLCILMSL